MDVVADFPTDPDKTSSSSQVKKEKTAGRKILDSVRLTSSVEQIRFVFKFLQFRSLFLLIFYDNFNFCLKTVKE